MKRLISASVLVVLGGISILFFMNYKNTENQKITFASTSLPYSSDPMEYDSYIHHYAFTSVFGTLVTAGKKGAISSQIAEHWSHDKDSKHWVFKLKKGLKYSNGDSITASDYADCLKRLAYLIKISKSQTGLIEYLEDFDDIREINNIKSIYSEGNELHFKFSQSFPDAAFRLAFGFYSLVHPSLYDHVSGKWINHKQTISSNSYEVKSWTDNSFILSLRKDLPTFDYSKAVEQIEFINLNSIKNSQDLQAVDLAIADKQSLMFDSTFEYIGTDEGFNLGYVECYGWDDKNNPMSDLDIRQWLRYKFYEGLMANGMEVSTSFFPPALVGVDNIKREYKRNKPSFKNFNITTHTMTRSSKIEENRDRKSVQEIMDFALKNLGSDSGIDVNQIDYNESMDIEKVLNLAINGTGIESENFNDTVRFMFNSKHGANLPDQNGKIKNELTKDLPDINFINQEIWNQAIIWPIRAYSKGHWFKKNNHFNFDEVNLKIPAIDFQFVERV